MEVEVSPADTPRVANVPVNRVFELPGIDRNKEIKLKVMTFTGVHGCGQLGTFTVTMRGNVGQSMKDLRFHMTEPAETCPRCGNSFAGLNLGLDPQHGENPVM